MGREKKGRQNRREEKRGKERVSGSSGYNKKRKGEREEMRE